MLHSTVMVRYSRHTWINSRPEEENWNIISSGILDRSLGTGKYTYHPRTLSTVFRYTKLRIPTPSNVPPLLMAPFEILSNSDTDRIDDGIWRRIPRGLKPRNRNWGRTPRELNLDQVRNLTVEIACEINSTLLNTHALDNSSREFSMSSHNSDWVDPVDVYSREVKADYPNGSDHDHDELILCKVVLHVLKLVTSNALGGAPKSTHTSMSSFRDVVKEFTTPAGPSLSFAERSLTEHGFASYLDLFDTWPCSLKEQLVQCITGDGTMKIVKLAPDLSSVMFVCMQKPAEYCYMHSGRGIAINKLHGLEHYGEPREKLRYHRGSWEAPSRLRTAAAWTYVLVSLGFSIYRAYLQREEGVLEATISGIELLSILLIAVFGFVKLYVYDDAVLFRLMTGWRALNTRESMLRYFCPGLRDVEECEAEMAREVNSWGDEQFALVNACAQRTQNKTGSIRLEGVKDEYLGRAGYIGLGTLIIDYPLKEVILVRQFGTGFGHFEKRAPLTTENVSKFLEEAPNINDSAERELITRRVSRYRGMSVSELRRMNTS